MRIAIGGAITLIALAVAGRRFFWLFKLIRTGQPAPGRLDDLRASIWSEISEVGGQRKLLKWSVPGLAHAFTFWGFTILLLTIIEAYGALFDHDFHIPLFGHWAAIGFIEDFFAVAVLAGLITFAIIRVNRAPKRLERKSRFYGSHLGPAWVIIGMISAVIVTLLITRGAQFNAGTHPQGDTKWAFASWIVSLPLEPAGHTANEHIETVFLLVNLAIIMGFLVLVAYSKHLHIFLAPINVVLKRQPKALGSLGTTPDIEKLMEEDEPIVGAGKVEDFSWKAMLDFSTCTECGRCQSQCPAWNTGKPLSPKLVIMDLRDHLFAKAPYLLAGTDAESRDAAWDAKVAAAHEGHDHAPGEGHEAEEHHVHHVPESGFGRVPEPGKAQAERPLVGTEEEGGVIDPDVLWSCTNCGACVEQCPVDIEHVDHIVDMRRYQVMIESAFPSEAGVMLRNLENNGNPWGVSPRSRTEWTEGLPFQVRIIGDGEQIPDDVEYLFWVGCAGAIEDRAKKVSRAFAELLDMAGVSFAILGSQESCTGDPARRLGNEYLFQEMAKANIELLNETGVKKIVATCPHCFNALSKEYTALGGAWEVVHHTQLLGKLVEERKLVPINPIESSVTYHDPCFLGRHNKVYTPPREILEAIPGLRGQEMHRCKDRGFCCGAGGARMWMEEKIGTRINSNRVEEALGLDPDVVSTACPFCIVMLSDAVTEQKLAGTAKETVEVLDVSQLLARSLAPATPAAAGDDAEPAPVG
ncbi:(Fe-S)-binding protein [Frankia sp. CNm7]|uniref:(Fe-S)-binding protein n=1 Tax=Frankia nepalensis TaxID=1836974 RepID=A0A937RCL7_9ACTN|nr:(Fe-S)-binding protein [Frankia nepalensis]MBL7495153.1 (Fe-S)-binding protein [Frankia nepalensis]MBL7509884.1 (Fe-S)-binding protein [Frankia nepalensis]MBL7520678.1 (Fe-S)-binding protein [Frankia nepalensis]MBL7629643.1 (Fe-S)-binding protein [Frankia nepalensis]